MASAATPDASTTMFGIVMKRTIMTARLRYLIIPRMAPTATALTIAFALTGPAAAPAGTNWNN
jgi:hypothetical protein